MKLSSLIEALPAEEVKRIGIKAGEDVDVYSVGFDSRQSLPGELFVALKGTNFDGEDYVDDALSRGAVAIVSEREALRLGCDVPEVVVKDAKLALGFMSAGFFGSPTERMRLIGVTGTNGKTTVTYIIESILRAAKRTTGLLGTIGYSFGGKTLKAPYTTPLAPQLQGFFKEMVEAGTTDCVMEVSSHALSERRVDGCRFDALIFTNLTEEHLDYHDTMNQYFRAKERLFRDARLHKSGAKAVVNIDDMWGEMLTNDSSGGLIKYSLDDNGADIYPLKSSVMPEGITAIFATPIGELKVSSRLTGEYNLYNIMAAIGAAIAVGIEKVAIEEGIARLACVPGRLERVALESKLFAYVDYAHTPDALKRSIEVLRGFVDARGGRLITVFGCGGDRDKTKRPLMGEIAASLSNVAIITTDNPRGEEPIDIVREVAAGIKEAKEIDADALLNADTNGYMMLLDRRDAIERAVAMADEGDTILLAGKGHEDYQLVKGERLFFDDRAELNEAISKRFADEPS
ncbi:MAG: UDP-N-acetylmuramoyl-L-alanyl-D-glutamate--2,6-diaminopimelate ligase [Deltaproteobacteria bacterium]|nr:UDP-N-acetylmuramoyl-L-alanyl-D-glutamate--2,6-diaminopimelate ligase [Deltaproteobacteria bacterium]